MIPRVADTNPGAAKSRPLRGNRRLRYRGITKNNAWLHHRTAALNLRRLLVLGLTFEDGTWALA